MKSLLRWFLLCLALAQLGTATAQAPNPAATAVANYQGIWWNAPAESEPGWGINFAHQGDTIFATWFTFGQDGKPLWLVVAANRTAPDVYAGDVYTGTGSPFDRVPFDPGATAPIKVGSATLSFAGADSATAGVHGERQRADQEPHPPGVLRAGADLRLGRTGGPGGRDQLPGHVVGRAAGRRAGLGDQLRAPGRHDIRDLVHLRRRRQAAVDGGGGEQDRGEGLFGRAVHGHRPRVRRGAVRPRQGGRHAGGDGDVELRRRQQRDLRLHARRRDAKQGDHPPGVRAAGDGLPAAARARPVVRADLVPGFAAAVTGRIPRRVRDRHAAQRLQRRRRAERVGPALGRRAPVFARDAQRGSRCGVGDAAADRIRHGARDRQYRHGHGQRSGRRGRQGTGLAGAGRRARPGSRRPAAGRGRGGGGALPRAEPPEPVADRLRAGGRGVHGHASRVPGRGRRRARR